MLLALKSHDEAALERAFVQLKTFYADARRPLGPSPNEAMMLGLNLLRLLTQNRIAEFHTELELVPPEVGGRGCGMGGIGGTARGVGAGGGGRPKWPAIAGASGGCKWRGLAAAALLSGAGRAAGGAR